jgi:hypothetical protein
MRKTARLPVLLFVFALVLPACTSTKPLEEAALPVEPEAIAELQTIEEPQAAVEAQIIEEPQVEVMVAAEPESSNVMSSGDDEVLLPL